MKNRIIQIALIAFTVVFALWVVSVFSADRLYSMSLAVGAGKISPEKGISMLEIAGKLTPGDARLYARKYDLMPLITQGAGRLLSGQRSGVKGQGGEQSSAFAVIASREPSERRGNLKTVIPSEAEGSPQRVIPSEAEGRVEGSKETPDELTSSRAHELTQGVSSATQSQNLRNLNERSADDNLRNQQSDSIPLHSGRPTTVDRRPKPGNLLYERQLQVIARCVDLSPSVASFHYRYALTMRKVLPRMTIQATRYLLSEFKKASELKPCSADYRNMYEKYEGRYGAGK